VVPFVTIIATGRNINNHILISSGVSADHTREAHAINWTGELTSTWVKGAEIAYLMELSQSSNHGALKLVVS
jgi:hypothetical protein